MLQKRKVLPPLDYLLAFETAAQAGSFARASEMLNTSESAVSRKVRLLEQHYNVPLFVRGHRSISLTTQGTTLLASVTSALDVLREASEDMFAHHQTNAVTLAATNSVAALWLMPRLTRFRRSNARVKIMLVASDSDKECLSDPMDLTILRGDGDWPGYDARQLFGETIFPVCAPRYQRNRSKGIDLAALASLDLIEVRSDHPEWMTWKTWLGHQGIRDTSLQRTAYFNTYPLAIQAAVDGLGIALGWGHLVDGLLEAGELIRPLPEHFARTTSGYYLLKDPKKRAFPERAIVEDWLIGESERRRRYGAPSDV